MRLLVLSTFATLINHSLSFTVNTHYNFSWGLSQIQFQQDLSMKPIYDGSILALGSTSDDDEPSSTVLQEGIDQTWRHVPKPLLRIGGKGIAESHGNSLRELLNAHTVVKVKINSTKLGSLEDVFETLKSTVDKSEDCPGVELIHVRNSENTILIGKKGTMDDIREGKFPPSD